MNIITFFEIQAADPETAMQFYGEVFGWTFTKDESIPIEYYRIVTQGMHGGLLKRPAKTPPTEHGTNAFTCSIQVEDFDRTSEMILLYHGRIAMPKFAVIGKCWQGYFLDPDNNIFGIFQIDEQAK